MDEGDRGEGQGSAPMPVALELRRYGQWFLESPIGSADGRYFAFYANSSLGPVYGEITAYAISMACVWYRRSGDERYLNRARRCAGYLLSVSHPGVYGPSDQRVYVFDTGILATGLLDLFDITGETFYIEEAMCRLDWLLEQFSAESLPATVPEDGAPGRAWPLRRSVHLAKMALPLLKAWRATREGRYRDGALRLLRWALGLQTPDGRFRIGDWSSVTMTHPHCYVSEALLYGVWVLQEPDFREALARAANWLAGAQSADGSFFKWYPAMAGVSGLRRVVTRVVKTKVSDATAQSLRIWRVMGVHSEAASRAASYLRSVAALDGGLANYVRKVGPIKWRESLVYAWPTFFWHHALAIRFGDADAAKEIF